MTYSLDSSALIDAWERFYPPEHFPKLWDFVEDGITRKHLVATDEVEIELSKKSEELREWTAERGLYVPLSEEIQIATRRILSFSPRLAGVGRSRGRADPFVIAVAMVNACTVVTHEGPSANPNSAKIPNVCDHFGIRYLDFPGMIRECGWQVG